MGDLSTARGATPICLVSIFSSLYNEISLFYSLPCIAACFLAGR